MTSVPPVPPQPAQAVPVAAGTVSGDATQGRITSLPPSLESTDRAIVLRGEVQAVKQDGTVTIATPRGPVDVKLPQPLPTQGQRVEVTLPAGSPPAEATVRNVQTQAPAPQPLPQTNVPLPNPSAGTPPPTLPGQTQVPVQIPVHGQPAIPVPLPTAGSQAAAALSAVPLLQEDGPSVIVSQGNATPAAPQQGSQVSPQGLLNFLKSSLQTVLQTHPDAHPGDLGSQRPLQIGQLVRLIPTMQNPLATPPSVTAQPGQTPLGNQASPVLSPAVQSQSPVTTPGLQTPVLPQPQSAATQNPVQSSAFFQTIQNALPSAQMALNGQNILTNAVDRILLPLMGFTTAQPTAANGQTTPMGVPAQTGLAGLIKDMMTGMTVPRTGQTVSAPAVSLPQIQTPMIDARVSAILPGVQVAATGNPGIATLLHGTPVLPVLFAQVAGQSAQGLPIIQMPVFSGDGSPKTVMMTLQFPARPMAPGTWVRMDVMQTSSMTAPGAATSLPGMDGLTWESLDELLSTLRGQPQTAGAAQLTLNALPKPGSAAFTAPVLMFMAAARSGDITAWLGERTVDTVRNIRRADILARLTGTMAGATRQRDDAAATTEWKTVTLPMLGNDNALSQIQMHYRSFERDGDDAQQAEKKTGTRFVLDLSLTRMGPLQVDGLSLGRQLDVTLRSEQSFSSAMREALRARYTEALSGIGFSGQLNFAADGTHKGWVDFHEQSERHATARA